MSVTRNKIILQSHPFKSQAYYIGNLIEKWPVELVKRLLTSWLRQL